ncbi:helix-turn-helix transcriptional regulator [Natranaerobius thermophilus]|uniref:CBS domain containing protein n=1 Tax=Natranaerobius thermophilus (strain ATCC BAA-1301 / DSM 18059 / JW/NM-WN-LF) TaxID=457570 RepID=B2A1Y7_NATTJ|nr:helix-turn-helix transcriptional regulator [Natranaerobius thermophilus]ACB84792.1 CBS domain containing protein [Natranaerobius thermophilus JW/NM-WN-LF]
MNIRLSKRQNEIVKIVREKGPISGEEIASYLNLARATLRPDLSFLTMSGLLEARPKVGYYYTGKSIENALGDILKQNKVSDIKGLPVAVSEETSVYDAIVTLFLEDVGTIFVVDENNYLKGVASRKDFLKITLGDNDLGKMPVGIVMTRWPNIVTLRDEDTALSAAKKVEEFQVDCIPVISDDNVEEQAELTGRVSKTHLVKLLAEIDEQR